MRMAYRRRFADLTDEISDTDLVEDDPGEYFELERALTKIRKKLKKRRDQLSEERDESKALMSALTDAVVSVDLQDRVRFYNSKFAIQFLPNKQQSELVFTQIFREPELLLLIKEVIKNQQSKTRILFLKNPITTAYKYYSITISPVVSESEALLSGVLLLFHDISEVKRAEQIRIEFVENASHELRTPLTSIKGYLDALMDDFKTGNVTKASEFLAIISKSVDRLSLLVNDMLNLAHLDAGAGLQKELIDPSIVSEQVIQELATLAKSKKIQINLSNKAMHFSADSAKIEQVLENLIGNAIKYVQEGGAINVSWEMANDSIALKVSDNGPGIEAEHLPRLFERFYRVDKGRARDAGGTGLGLAIVKHIVQSHGGEVEVASTMGKGSEFICYFPKTADH
jgi:two-component system phosphate regulon sensor histidine kinase PhoR